MSSGQRRLTRTSKCTWVRLMEPLRHNFFSLSLSFSLFLSFSEIYRSVFFLRSRIRDLFKTPSFPHRNTFSTQEPSFPTQESVQLLSGHLTSTRISTDTFQTICASEHHKIIATALLCLQCACGYLCVLHVWCSEDNARSVTP